MTKMLIVMKYSVGDCGGHDLNDDVIVITSSSSC